MPYDMSRSSYVTWLTCTTHREKSQQSNLAFWYVFSYKVQFMCVYFWCASTHLQQSTTSQKSNLAFRYMFSIHVFSLGVFGLCVVSCDVPWLTCTHSWYGVATASRIDKFIRLFCRISSLLYGSFAKETYGFIDPTNRSHPILPQRLAVQNSQQSDLAFRYVFIIYAFSSGVYSLCAVSFDVPWLTCSTHSWYFHRDLRWETVSKVISRFLHSSYMMPSTSALWSKVKHVVKWK